VSAAVSEAVRPLTGSVVRLAGGDRYDTSRRIAQYAFPNGRVPIAYVASGTSFPDALSATGAAGSQGGPVLLTPGDDASGAVVGPTLAGLSPQRIAVVGGPNAVTSRVDAALRAIAPVQRLAGSDRFATNAAVAAFAFAGESGHATALVASGLNFPDALTGAAWGGHAHVPLLLTAGTCLAKPEADQLYTLGVGSLTILGGANVVGESVARGTMC
jgi:putative cell wall-binding protein